MYSISPDHAIGLVGGLLALPLALALLRLHPRWRSVPGTVRGAAVLMAVSAGVHFALIGGAKPPGAATAAPFFFYRPAFLALPPPFPRRARAPPPPPPPPPP